ncbi:MAG: hypothetical protein US61_C0011G0017 [Parcubacteria group bacterium GW2011_GWE2_37_8]|nr:MAG: hypothetical protein US61_C0011G0017 [Parcubacteria group bacterium GW2011_GWE2_37_8]
MSVSSRVEKTNSECRICGGAIVAKTVTVYNPEAGSPIYGPGSKRQYKDIRKQQEKIKESNFLLKVELMV